MHTFYSQSCVDLRISSHVIGPASEFSCVVRESFRNAQLGESILDALLVIGVVFNISPIFVPLISRGRKSSRSEDFWINQ